MSIALAANPSIYGQPVTIAATVIPAVSSTAGTPTGSVTFFDDGVLLGTALLSNGVAQLSTSNLVGGAHEITARYDGDSDYFGATADLNQTVNKADQTINFQSLADGSYNGDSIEMVFIASSGLPVSLAVLNGPATIIGNRLTITGAGTVVIEASQSGDSNFNAATLSHAFTVNRLTRTGRLDPTFGTGGEQSIDFSDLNFSILFDYYGIVDYGLNFPSRDRAFGVTVGADGSLLVAGTLLETYGYQQFNVQALLTAGGTVQYADFGTGPITPIAIQADGKVIVVGVSNHGATGNDFLVQRYNADSSIDTSFGNAGTVIIDFGSSDDVATGVAVQQDGKIIVVGYTLRPNGNYNFAVARLEGVDPTAVGTAGDDSITIAPGTQSGTLKVTVNGVVTDNQPTNATMLIEGGGGNDTFTVTAAPAASLILAGQGGSDTYDISFSNLSGTVVVADDSDTGTNQLIARGTVGDDYIFKDGTQVTWSNPAKETISYIGVNSLAIHGGAGNDTIVDPGTDTHIFGDAGNDTIIINATSGNGVNVDGGAGSDSYVIGGGILAGPVSIADTGTSGTDRIKVVGMGGGDAIVQTTTGFTLNGTTISMTGLAQLPQQVFQ